MMTSEDRYIRKRLREARRQAREFYYCRKYPIQENKIVFMNIEGTVGYGCNPKYICEEMRRRNKVRRENGEKPYDLVWLVDDTSLPFPDDVRVVKNTLKNRAYELSTAAVWVDNSRKQLEVRKRPGQFYLQTWHANICMKPIGLQRGASFSRIAYLVSKHDSDMADYVLSDSEYYEKNILPKGVLYEGNVLRVGTPRCDVLVSRSEEMHRVMRERYGLPADCHIFMYAPTFRGGSQKTNRSIDLPDFEPNYDAIIEALKKRFGGDWRIFLRLHPQLTARRFRAKTNKPLVIDVSRDADMYELLAACDAFMTDYSCVSFDAMSMRIPIFLYVPDIEQYEAERGKLLWNLNDLPFPWALNDEELDIKILSFDEEKYNIELDEFFKMAKMNEPGNASVKTVDFIENWLVEKFDGEKHEHS